MPALSRPAPFHRQRFGRIPAARIYSGLGRSSLYRLAGMTPGLFKKHGKSTLVDFDVLDQILDALPEATIAKPRT